MADPTVYFGPPLKNNPLQFWLTFNNSEYELRLPVNPDQISLTFEHGVEDFTLAQLGDYSIIGKRKATGLSFSSFFPARFAESYCEYEEIPNPWEAIALLKEWQTSGRPMRVLITGTPINMAVTLRTLTIEAEKGGEPGDIYFSAEFREYFFLKIRKVSDLNKGNATSGSGTKRTNTKAQTVTSYVVKKGDSLWKIAARSDIYGNGDQWRKIYSANKKTIGANPNLIYPGQKLVIPR